MFSVPLEGFTGCTRELLRHGLRRWARVRPPVQTRIRRNAKTAMTNIATASMARTPSSSDTVGVTALNKPARKMSVVYVNGLARLAACIAEGAALAGKNTDEVKRKMKNAKVDTIWNVSDDFRTTERAMANAPKKIVPRNSAPAIRSAPSQVGAKLAPNTGNAKPKTRREPATPIISVAKMMLKMYWARVKGPIKSCSNIPFFRSNQSCVPALVPPLMTVSVTAPAARKRE